MAGQIAPPAGTQVKSVSELSRVLCYFILFLFLFFHFLFLDSSTDSPSRIDRGGDGGWF